MYRTIPLLAFLLTASALGQTTRPAVTVLTWGKRTAETKGWPIAATPDFKHAALIHRQDRKSFVMLDGKPEAGFDWILPGTVCFSVDGSTLAYIAQNGNDVFAVVNEKPGPAYYEISTPILLSDDGKHVTYAARPKDGLWRVVTDGVEQPKSYAAIAALQMSHDGARVAYIARHGGAFSVVDNGKEVLTAPGVQRESARLLSPDGKRLLFVYGKDDGKKQLTIRVDDQEFGPFAMSWEPRFTPDSAHWFTVVREPGAASDARTIYFDGKPLSKPDEIAINLTLTRDLKHHAYFCRKDKEEYIVFDGRPQQRFLFNSIVPSGTAISADGKHVTYMSVSVEKRERTLWLDDKVLEKGEWMSTLFFNPAGGRWAYLNGKPDNAGLVVDGKQFPPRRLGHPGQSVWSKDGKHLIYFVQDSAGNLGLAIDDQTIPTTARLHVGEQVFFETPTRAVFLGVDNDENFNRYTIDFPTAP